MNVYTIRPIVTGYTHTHKGTYIYHHTTHKYYDAEAINFIKKVRIFATLDAQHRFVVRVVAP